MNDTSYVYPFEHVVGDYIRAGIGFVLMVAPLLFIPLPRVLFVIFSLLALLFVGFGIQTALRHRMKIQVTDEEILVMPNRLRLRWTELTDVSLEYYATAKESKSGWMQLTLRSKRRRLRVDSRLNGFDDIARHAAISARANDLVLSPTTVTNFSAFGVDLAEQSADQRRPSNG